MRKRIFWVLLLSMILLSGCEWLPEKETITKLSVVTYNIHYGANQKGVYNLDAIRSTLASLEADVIVLQEVDQNWSARSQNTYQLDVLANQLGMNSAFVASLTSKTGQYGLGILSKYPIKKVEKHFLAGQLEQRVLMVAELEVEGQDLIVFNTHLGLSKDDRLTQVEGMRRITERYAGRPIVLMGDFNAERNEGELARIFEHFYDGAKIRSGPPETLIGQRAKIDFIFVSNEMMILNETTVSSNASDHYPVQAKVVIF